MCPNHFARPSRGQDREFESPRSNAFLSPQGGHEGACLGKGQGSVMLDTCDLGLLGQELV